MILSFGSFFSCTNSASEMRVEKSFTITALIQSAQTAITARSYFLSQLRISYASPSIPRFSELCFSLEIE